MLTKIKFKPDINDTKEELNYMENLLSQHDADYDELMPILEKYFGFTNVKTKDELKNIFIECENNYSKMKFYFGFFKLAKQYFTHFIDYFK